MKHYFILLSIALMITSGCKTSSTEYEKKEGEITWIDIPTADKISNSEGKMYFIDMYTDWCGWCKVMDKKTFTDPNIIQYMTEHFHSIKFDAEQKESVIFNGKKYDWQPKGRNGVNALAEELLKGRLSYPSYVYLDKDKNFIKITNGYLPPENFITDLKSVTK